MSHATSRSTGPRESRYDVVVVGAGTSGAATAALCAERGLRVLCLDRGALDDAGARWVNGVTEQAFIDAGIKIPRHPELRGRDGRFHLIAGWGPQRLSLADHGVLEVDMRLLIARLHERARRAGVEFIGEVEVAGMEARGLQTSLGVVATRFAVDASGLHGARLLDQPRVPPAHLCTAAQRVHRVNDRRAALAFCAHHRVRVSEVACFTGIAGGFSIVNVSTDGEEVSILTGSIPAAGQPGGKALLDRFAAENSWIGERVFGGARAIPLRRPYDRLANERVALIGDAGCQVFSAHGSGVAVGLVAARTLADALASGAGPEGYARTWQRRHGGLLATYDLFRRFSQTLTVADVERMMASGLMDPTMVRAGMSQSLPKMTPPAAASKVRGLARAPDLALRMAATLVRIPVVLGMYSSYPANLAQLPRWSKLVARVFGETPDV